MASLRAEFERRIRLAVDRVYSAPDYDPAMVFYGPVTVDQARALSHLVQIGFAGMEVGSRLDEPLDVEYNVIIRHSDRSGAFELLDPMVEELLGLGVELDVDEELVSEVGQTVLTISLSPAES